VSDLPYNLSVPQLHFLCVYFSFQQCLLGCCAQDVHTLGSQQVLQHSVTVLLAINSRSLLQNAKYALFPLASLSRRNTYQLKTVQRCKQGLSCFYANVNSSLGKNAVLLETLHVQVRLTASLKTSKSTELHQSYVLVRISPPLCHFLGKLTRCKFWTWEGGLFSFCGGFFLPDLQLCSLRVCFGWS